MSKGCVQHNNGAMLVNVLVFASVSVVIMTAIITGSVSTLNLSKSVYERELAVHMAEAGNDYYRWHLAHDNDDYQDGTGREGPYIHTFENAAGETIGTFSLEITPPPVGSTLVTINSTASTTDSTGTTTAGVARTIQTQLAIPSFAKYAVVANDEMRFGSGTEVYGEIQSNGGIRFDGLAHNIVSSAQSEYDDPDHSGGNEFGVHTHIAPTDPLPPASVPNRTDVFVAGRVFPVPAVDFAGITSDLATMKADAQGPDGHYFSDSGALGYHIIFNTNDTFNIYRVTAWDNPPWFCYNAAGQDDWGTWSIRTQVSLGSYGMPANGIIFLEDDVWVSGQIDSARVTVASGKFPDNPSTRTSITINEDLEYTNYDGQDVIALIAQKNINVGMDSEDDLRIDAALMAQNGRVGRFYYPGPWWFFNRCSPYHDRDTITLYGMIGTNERYGFAYTDGNGYDNRNLNYDSFLLYGPPPSFPLTTDQYETVVWDEI